MQFFNKQIIWLCLSFLLPMWAKAQVSAYTFSQLSGTYTPITGGSVLGTTANDDEQFVDPAALAGGFTPTGVGFPIGFNFTFNGTIFDRFAVDNNGWIVLGQSALTPAVNATSSSYYNPISANTTTTPPQLANRIAGFARDLQGQAGSELRFETIGTAPNRVLVVQWSNYRRWNVATGNNFNFQIRLRETSNIVEVVYGTFTTTETATNTAQVGLRGINNTDFNNRSVVSGTSTWATSTAGGTNAATAAFLSTLVPTSGQTYRWTPASCAPPVGLAATTPSPTSANFTWTTNITNGQIVVVPQGNAVTTGTPSPITGTSASNNSLAAGTSYSVFIRTICAVGDTSNWSLAVNFTTPCVNLTAPWTESFETVPVTTTGGPMPNCWARTGDFFTGNGTQSFNRSARTGTKYLYTQWTTIAGGDWAWTPAFDLIAGRQYDFSFWYKADGSNGFDTLRVGVGNAQNAGAMTIIGTPAYNVINTAYQQYFVSFIPSTTGTYYFGVNVWEATATPWYITFDDFNLIETPTCPQPNGITFPSLRPDSTVIAWNSPAPGNSWFVYYGATGTTPSGTGTLVTTNPYTITGLNPNTNYTFFVRELCSAGDTSAWSGPFNFITDCAPSTAGDSIQTAINVNTTNYSNSNSTARCYTSTIGNTSPDVWYRVILDPCATQITASLCTGTTYDSYLRIYDATGTTQLAFNDDGCGAQSIISNLDVRAHDTVYVVVEGWTAGVSGSFTISISQTSVTPTADISYTNTSYCMNGANPIAVNSGSTGGVFSANPSTLTLDPVNGELNLSSAMAGASYQIIYSVGQPGCLYVDSFQVAVTPADNADFNYSPATNEHLCETNTAATANVLGLAGGTFSTPSAGLSLNTTSGTIDASSSAPGMHRVYYTTNGICPNMDSVMVQIDTTEDASFDYLPTNVCNNVANINPTLTGLMGGLYTSAAGLMIDSLTGEINVMMSAAGSYTVSYTLPNACASQATDMLMITPMDDASFTYNSTVYCQNAAHPMPMVTGMMGGTFSSNTGLPVDIGTGVIDLNNATVNTPQTVIYATNGACVNFSIFTVTILPADTADFSYDSVTYCQTSSPNLQIPTLEGSAGSFTVLGGGLNINPNTGAFALDTALNNAGTFTIRHISTGPTTCRDTAEFTVTLLNCFPVSINETANEMGLNLYPNPNFGQFYVVATQANEAVNLDLIDVLGRNVLSQQNVWLSAQPYAISTQNLPAGTYYLRVSDGSKVQTLPVVLMQP